MRAFVAVVEEGGLSAAARRLHITRVGPHVARGQVFWHELMSGPTAVRIERNGQLGLRAST